MEHILQELGFVVRPVGDEMHGSAAIVPEMWVPGTDVLRTSILAAWTDVLSGLLAVDVLAPSVPVTLDLDVHVYEPRHGTGRVTGVARMLKAGRAVAAAVVDFTDETGALVATGGATFMAAPDPEMRMPPGRLHLDAVAQEGGPLRIPLAERAGCQRLSGGVASLPRTPASLNSSGTVNGGLLALVAEEAALDADAPGTTLASMSVRYLRPVRVGPAVARATVRAGLGRVEVCDDGRDGDVAVTAMTRAWRS